MEDYVILGGGIGGIISISVLYNKYPTKNFLWIDNNGFNTGDLINYPEVPANTPFKILVKFIQSIYRLLGLTRTVDEICASKDGNIFKLKCLSAELSLITSHIKSLDRVKTINDYISTINYQQEIWKLVGNSNTHECKNIILTTGSIHRKLDYKIPEIPIKTALNPHKLKTLDIINKNITVFGNSHSGILILKNLNDLGCKNITNIIQSPTKIPYVNDKGIEIYPESGIRGIGLDWVKNNMIPENKTDITINYYDPNKTISSDYVIYAIGLTRHKLIININGKVYDMDDLVIKDNFNKTGLLGPNLYGLGSGFPRKFILNGNIEYEIGMWGFLERATEIF